MTTNKEIFEALKVKASLSPNEQIKVYSYVSAGYDIMSAGIATWHLINGKIHRHTEQIRVSGMCVILDDAFLWQELMAALNCLQEQLLFDGVQPRELINAFYVHASNPLDKRSGIKLMLFPRVSAIVRNDNTI